MAAYKNELKDSTGDAVYPVTVADAVYMEKGKTVKSEIEQIHENVPIKFGVVNGKNGHYQGDEFIPFKSQADVDAAYQSGYEAGREQGHKDVLEDPNKYGLYTKEQYDENYDNGYTAGYSKGYTDGIKARSAANISVSAWNGGAAKETKTLIPGTYRWSASLEGDYVTSGASHIIVKNNTTGQTYFNENGDSWGVWGVTQVGKGGSFTLDKECSITVDFQCYLGTANGYCKIQ